MFNGRMGRSSNQLCAWACLWWQVGERSACGYRGVPNWRLGWHRTVREGCQTRESSAELTRQQLFLGFRLSVSRLATSPHQTQKICSALVLFSLCCYIKLLIFKTTIPSAELAASCPYVSWSKHALLNFLHCQNMRATLELCWLNMASHMFQQLELYFPCVHL